MRAFHAAIDLGAGSGRVLIGARTPSAFELAEVHRFHHAPRLLDGHLRWNLAQLVEGMRVGLSRAADAARVAGGELVSAGVDAWGVDYGLIDEHGRLIEEPICYRDERTERGMADVLARVPRDELFRRTGIQLLPLNTIFQLAAHVRAGLPSRASKLLLMPDLCHHVLCGSVVSELTTASTTQLMSLQTSGWDDTLFERLGLPRELMPDLVAAGHDLGPIGADWRAALDLPPLRVIAPATHDTASAVLGTPLQPRWAYISSGTWSLVGVERDAPLVDDRARAANVTNERGVGGTYRFLKNVMGLWLLESCCREWASAGAKQSLDRLLAAVAARPGITPWIYPDASRFFQPRRMTQEISAALVEAGHPSSDDPVTLTKVILDSLALRYASVVTTIETLTGTSIPGLHVVGGGARNDYLNQATANATERPVLAGPVEASAAGNVLMQAVASGTMASVADGRRAIAESVAPRRFAPKTDREWLQARERYAAIESAALEG